MKTLAAIFTQIISTTVMGSAVFMATQIISPLKTKTPIIETHIPRMTIRMDEFSTAWSALEDDYALDNGDEDSIPIDIPSRILVAGEKDYYSEIEKTHRPRLEIPKLSLNAASQDFGTVATLSSPIVQAPKGTEPALSSTKNPMQEQAIYNIPHFWIQGKIELSGGLALTHPKDEVKLGWFRRDEEERPGKVSIAEGTYELKVDRMEGELLAQLIDSKGSVLGESIVDLDVLAQSRSLNQMMVTGVDIKIVPVDFSAGKTISTYDSKIHKDPVPKATVYVGQHELSMASDEKGELTDPAITPTSIAVVSTSKAHYQGSLSLVDFQARPHLRMFPDKFLKALHDTLGTEKNRRDAGMIWGMVTKNGEPVGNYRIQIAKHEDHLPVYFNFYIPNRELKETSSDGQYVFVGLPDQEYELELIDATGKVVDAKVVAVRAGYVSQAEFEIGKSKVINVRPFDPLSSTRVELDLAVLGVENTFLGKSEDFIKIPIAANKDPLLVFSKAQQHKVSASTFASRQKKFQDIPILNESWWERMQQLYSIDVSSGVIVGFIDTDQPFEIFLEEPKAGRKVVYFNTRGEIVDKVKGEMASGFIVYNVGPGLKTLILQTETGLLQTEVAYVDGESVSLIYRQL
ncbi:MAG: hypothetical protein K2Q26_09380 [Bdellovibrionales bacterium]|nr:hypothetical protein [Bdellovibrionales bacterium]